MMQFKNLQIFDLHPSLLMLNQETDINLCPFEPPQNFWVVSHSDLVQL